MDENDKKYTVQEVSQLLNVHFTKVYTFIRSGDLHAINISTGSKRPRWIIPKSYLLEFMKKRSNG